MLKKTITIVVLSLAMLSLPCTLAFAAAGSTITGTVRDSNTKDVLPGASVSLAGTSLGASTDIDGRYAIHNVSPGSYNLRATYVGYTPVLFAIHIEAGADLQQDLKLDAVGVQGETVVITAQAQGQNEAINQQLSNTNIVNTVSAARIQELPDANAAESIGRLPGVSILRSGGEGNEVVIRGLQPKYNNVTVDGVRMSSSNPNDRSADLSMISPNMLEGIEVSKTVSADQDADVLGGTVNFKLKEPGAGYEEREGLGVNLLAQGGYNGLSNAPNKYDNYKFVGGVEGRFLEGHRLGLFAQADFERRNLTSNELSSSFAQIGNSTSQYQINSITLNTIPRDRERGNGTLLLDYILPDGKVTLSNFFSSGITATDNRSETYNIQQSLHQYNLAYSKSTLNMITNALTVDQQLPIFHAVLKLSHTYSETKDPNDWSIGFQQGPAGNGSKTLNQLYYQKANLNPQDIPKSIVIDTGATDLNTLVNSDSFSRERALTASLDFDAPLTVMEKVTAVIKFGGKYRYQTRSYLHDQTGSQGLSIQSASRADNLIASYFPSLPGNSTHLPINSFLDQGYSYGKFLNGDYPMNLPLNEAMLSQVSKIMQDHAAYFAQNNDLAYWHDYFNSTTNNYSGHEILSAFYLMATINVGEDITVIPGIRFQDLQTTYTAPRGQQDNSSLLGGPYFHYDTTLTVDHPYWLPDVSLRYKPLSWFDLRLSYSSTLAYPDYNSIIPRIDLSSSAIAWNNYQLSPSRSKNYDAYLSFYDNSIGLFTVGGFIKQIDDLIYAWSFYRSGAEALQYYPPGIAVAPSNALYNISTFVNDKYRVTNRGMELDWQTHFWYLPHPFDGLVFNINYTHIFSSSTYPYTENLGGRPIVIIDTTFTAPLVYQPNNIVNLSLGYDYDKFSVRLSMLYQADVFTGVVFWPQLRTQTSPYTRWDVSAKQGLPWLGLQLFANVSNLNGARDLSVLQMYPDIQQSAQAYDLTAVMGLSWQF